MPREFPFTIAGTYTGGLYDYTDAFQTLYNNDLFAPQIEYPEDMFWGAISNEYTRSKPSQIWANTQTNRLYISQYKGLSQQYCYTGKQFATLAASPYSDSAFYNWYAKDSDNVEIPKDTYPSVYTMSTHYALADKVNLSYYCQQVYIRVLHLDPNSREYLQITNNTLEEYEDYLESESPNTVLLVGFYFRSAIKRNYDTGYYEGTDNTGTGDGCCLFNVPYSDFVFTPFYGQTSGSSNDSSSRCVQVVDNSTDATFSSNSYGRAPGSRNFGLGLFEDKDYTVIPYYNGDAEIDITPIMQNTSTSSDVWLPYNTGDKYILYGRKTSGYTRHNITILPVFTLEELLSLIASYGMAFTPVDRGVTNMTFWDDLIYFPVLDENYIFHGEYTHGLPNLQNPFTGKKGSHETSYVPERPEPPDSDGNTESGDKVPNQFGRTVGVTSNFITNYLMTEGQISKLGEVLWTSWADDAVTMDMVNNFYGKFHDATGSWNVSDALQFIVSCRLFPCSLATLVNTTQVSSIPIGTGAFALQCGTQTEPNFFIANEATAILNCGEIEIRREYNDYRDFENTKITAYLPFCGSVELNPQDVVGKWLGCTYAIDLFDGSCKAFIYTLSGNDVGYEGAYYNVAIKQGQCGFLIPMSGTQAGQVASRQKVDGYTDGALLYQAAAGLMDSAMALAGYSDSNPVAGFNRFVTAGTASTTLAAQRLGRAGISAPSTSGGSGFTDFHQPASAYVQVRRSYYQEPLQYEHATGFPTNAQRYDNLSQFTGFVICHNVDLSGFTCHEDERSEIKALLESGVYL